MVSNHSSKDDTDFVTALTRATQKNLLPDLTRQILAQRSNPLKNSDLRTVEFRAGRWELLRPMPRRLADGVYRSEILF